MGSGREANIRVGTSDRERAVAALAEHLAGGRLEISEYEQRCAQATAARTRADLRALFDDLPEPHPGFDHRPPVVPTTVPVPVAGEDSLWERPAPRRNRRGLGMFLGVAAVSTVAVVAITATWWALAPLALLAVIIIMTS
ncbi:DUF1707 SHOCT-like domain-containing protein [Actinokineospora enzanensis]|uniref:DUF1707 SHOCT-like domain-containing protein n=1 Tax=Actinokineospora enzanensis TaxID=155975 RepID=UPI0003A82B2E|nr:DUF1707 domain-containing protein [Actinokineospora enzanensis]